MSRLLPRALVVTALAVFLAPVLWLLTTAYKPARDSFGFPPRLAFDPTLDNFRAIAQLFDLPQLLGTSLLVSGGATGLALLLGVPAGYALARSASRLAMGVAYLFLAVRMLPPVATLIPFYVLMRDMGLLGTPFAVILIHGMLSTTLVAWLMFGRTRRKEAERFTRSVVAMRSEAQSLEALLEVLSQRIADSRSELTMITQHLMALGDEATGKLSGITREFDTSSERLARHGEALGR